MIRIKPGVSIKLLKPQMVPALITANKVLGLYNEDCWITSGDDGQHGQNSKHYEGLAVDIRTRILPGGSTGLLASHIAGLIGDALGHLYDVVLERTHIHIEYDPD